MKIPPYLKKGDTIAITCPAGYMPKEKAQTCIDTLQNWGYEVLVGKTLGSNSKNYFSGTDQERLHEFQALLDAPEVNAILCGRGGYGISRLIDRLDFTSFKKNPKWIIGFSDVTVLHAHVNRNLNIATLHASMASAFNDKGYLNKYVRSIKTALEGSETVFKVKSSKYNKTGTSTGELIGGNLSLLVHLIGTVSDIQTKNKILFVEDIGEQLYHIDRMFLQLKRSGKLESVAGLIIGGFTDLKDTERPFGKTIQQLITEHLAEYNFPVCFGFPVSHSKENYALKCGCTYTLKITPHESILKEN